MHELLFGYFLTRFQVLIILLLAAGVGGAIYCAWRKSWQSKLGTLEQELTRVREEVRILEAQVEGARQPDAFRHSDLLSGLTFISTKSAETLSGLERDQAVLREKQGLIISKAQDLLQSATNALDMSEPEPEELEKELLNVKGLVEMVLREFHPYAESKGVTLLTKLADVEPALLNRDLTLRALKNVIHNAIKYSHPGGIVEIVLDLEGGEKDEEK